MKFSISRIKILLTISFGVLFLGYSFANIGGKGVYQCDNINSCGIDTQYHSEIQCRKPPLNSSSNAAPGEDGWFDSEELENLEDDIISAYSIDGYSTIGDVVDLQETIVKYRQITKDPNCKLSCVDGRYGNQTASKIDMNCVPCAEFGYRDPEEGVCPSGFELTNNYGDDIRLEDTDYTRQCCVSEDGTQNTLNKCDKYRYRGVQKECCGILLNTDVPFIGKCISFSSNGVTPMNAFPRLMGGLSKIAITAILVFSFMMIIAGGVMISAGGFGDNYSKGKKIIMQVAIGIALLGASGVILRLINPNFFG